MDGWMDGRPGGGKNGSTDRDIGREKDTKIKFRLVSLNV